MKRGLIAIASLGILVPAAWVLEANAQYGAPAPAYSQPPAYAPSQTYPRRSHSRRTYRSARRGSPYRGSPSNGGVVYEPGSGPPPYDIQRSASANQPWEWHGAPGPNRRGNMCVTHTDPLRGYGYQAACPPPKR
jgi:hypothetical protein